MNRISEKTELYTAPEMKVKELQLRHVIATSPTLETSAEGVTEETGEW